MPQSTQPQTWSTRTLLAWMQQAFHEKSLESPRLLAELLLSHVLGVDRLKLYLDPDRPASPLERATLRSLALRALGHEPVQYLVGEAWFFGLAFKCDRRALIPRACTETIVEHVLQHYRASHGPSGAASASRGGGLLIADICTGTGCIAITLLKHLPGARSVATDISADALDLARLNAQRHVVADRIEFLEGDLLAPLATYPPSRGGASLDYLVSNPPYIPDDEWPGAVDENVREHEPEIALRGGPDGMKFAGPMLADGARLLKPGGLMLVEVASARAPQALAMGLNNPLLENVRIVKDHEGLDRVLLGKKRVEHA